MIAMLLSIAAAYGVLLVAGNALLSIVCYRHPPPTGLERAALAMPLGVLTISICLFIGSLLSPGRVGPIWVLIPTIFLAIIARPWRFNLPTRPALDQDDRAALLVLGTLVMGFTAGDLMSSFSWDGAFLWNHRAIVVYRSGGFPLSLLSDSTRAIFHQDYPLLIPLAEAWFYFVAGQDDGVLARALFPGFYAASLVLLYNCVAQVQSKRTARILTATAGLVIAAADARGMVGYADMPLALYWGGSVLFTYRWWSRRCISAEPSLAAVLAVGGAWTKNEGLVYFGLLIVTLILSRWIVGLSTPRRAWFWLAGTASVTVLPWQITLRRYGPFPGDFMPFSQAIAQFTPGKAWVVASSCLRELTDLGSWGPWWILVAIALARLLLGRVSRADLLLALSVTVPLLLLSGSYLLSTREPVEIHIQQSFGRIAMHHILPSVLLMAGGLGDLLEGPAKPPPLPDRQLEGEAGAVIVEH